MCSVLSTDTGLFITRLTMLCRFSVLRLLRCCDQQRRASLSAAACWSVFACRPCCRAMLMVSMLC